MASRDEGTSLLQSTNEWSRTILSAVVATLRLTQTCTSAALEAVRDADRVVQTDRTFPLDERLKDYTSLLSLVYQDVTKLAIALKPSTPTYQAALSPAKDLAGHLDALGSCACSIDRREYGGTVTQEVRWTAEDVLRAVEALLSVYMNDMHYEQGASEAENSKGTPYLVRTGVVHEAIDRARGIPHSNREAVRRRWDGIVGGMEDCQHEIQEILDEEDVKEGGKDEDTTDLSDDDGWNDLVDIKEEAETKTEAATEAELTRLKCVCGACSCPRPSNPFHAMKPSFLCHGKRALPLGLDFPANACIIRSKNFSNLHMPCSKRRTRCFFPRLRLP